MVDEQDDEIKKVNELILHAKCNAIRDAQCAEREEILKTMEEEEVRCVKVMETLVSNKMYKMQVYIFQRIVHRKFLCP